MIIDCDRCVVRGPAACGDCVVTVLLGAPPGGVELDAEEQAAIEALSGAGLVPPLRLVTDGEQADTARQEEAAGPSRRAGRRRAAGFD